MSATIGPPSSGLALASPTDKNYPNRLTFGAATPRSTRYSSTAYQSTSPSRDDDEVSSLTSRSTASSSDISVDSQHEDYAQRLAEESRSSGLRYPPITKSTYSSQGELYASGRGWGTSGASWSTDTDVKVENAMPGKVHRSYRVPVGPESNNVSEDSTSQQFYSALSSKNSRPVLDRYDSTSSWTDMTNANSDDNYPGFDMSIEPEGMVATLHSRPQPNSLFAHNISDSDIASTVDSEGWVGETEGARNERYLRNKKAYDRMLDDQEGNQSKQAGWHLPSPFTRREYNASRSSLMSTLPPETTNAASLEPGRTEANAIHVEQTWDLHSSDRPRSRAGLSGISYAEPGFPPLQEGVWNGPYTNTENESHPKSKRTPLRSYLRRPSFWSKMTQSYADPSPTSLASSSLTIANTATSPREGKKTWLDRSGGSKHGSMSQSTASQSSLGRATSSIAKKLRTLATGASRQFSSFVPSFSRHQRKASKQGKDNDTEPGTSASSLGRFKQRAVRMYNTALKSTAGLSKSSLEKDRSEETRPTGWWRGLGTRGSKSADQTSAESSQNWGTRTECTGSSVASLSQHEEASPRRGVRSRLGLKRSNTADSRHTAGTHRSIRSRLPSFKPFSAIASAASRLTARSKHSASLSGFPSVSRDQGTEQTGQRNARSHRPPRKQNPASRMLSRYDDHRSYKRDMKTALERSKWEFSAAPSARYY